MSLLLQCQKISKSFGIRTLFQDVSFSIFQNDRLGLIGVNGSGKSTLLKIMAGIEKPDQGEVTSRRNLKIGYVPQDSPLVHLSLMDILKEELKTDPRPDYEKELAIEILLDKMGFTDPSVICSTLSGGWRKKVEIARKVLLDPDLLLLDEPTNHLDLESIVWLEKFLPSTNFAYVIVSHDRSFLTHVTEKTAELGNQFPDGLFQIDVAYDAFLTFKEDFLEGQKTREHSLRSKARRELSWLRANPKARTTKSSARIQEAHELFDELSKVKARNTRKVASIDFTASERETRKLVSMHNGSYNYGGRVIFEHLDLVLSPKMRLGLLGQNGSGKTTLLRVLSKELKPCQGTIKYADGLKIVYFDQHRFALTANSTIRESLSAKGDFVRYQNREIHVSSWAERFLFPSSLLDMPIDKLSGGERARLLMAKLMLQPADILLLDEPTNDLDIPTLEILEESLLEFAGALVLITHDRTMLTNICNQFVALGKEPRPTFFSQFADWEKMDEPRENKTASRFSPNPSLQKVEIPSSKAKLSWKESKELEQIEPQILKLEKELKEMQKNLETADPTALQELCRTIGEHEKKIEKLYSRWAELS